MTRTDSRGRLSRLEQIEIQLRLDAFCTVKDLAQHHGVSERTIARDLALMREQGMPIDADRGRGGGVRLDRNWGVGRLNLAYGEAVDLLISIAVAEQMQSPIFLANLGAVKRQLIASFSPKKRQAVMQIKTRVLVGQTASPVVQTHFETPNQRVVQAVHQSFLDQRHLHIRYRAQDGSVTERDIEPHYLLLNYPIWYVIAFDHLRQVPRTFRCDRIEHAAQTETRFSLSPMDHFKQALEGNLVTV